MFVSSENTPAESESRSDDATLALRTTPALPAPTSTSNGASEKGLGMLHLDNSPTGDVGFGVDGLPGGPLDGSTTMEEKGTKEGGHVEVEYPDGGLRAWSVVLGAWCISFATWGYVNGFGVYQSYYEIHQLADRTPSEISWIGAFQLSMVLACAIVAGRAFDAGYIKYLLVGGTLTYAAGLFGLSFASTYWQIFLAQGVACGLASGVLFLPAVSSISHYFRKRRATALGILATGSSIGGVVYPVLLNKLFASSIGFGWAVRASAFLTVGLLVIACLTVDTRLPPRKGGAIVDFSVFKDPAYSCFVAGNFLIMWGLYTPMFYLQSYAVQNGVDENLAFYALSILNAASLFGRLIPNARIFSLGCPSFPSLTMRPTRRKWLADTWGPLTVLVPQCLLSGILIFVWLPAAKTAAGLVVFSILFGFTSGAFVSMLPACIASMTVRMNEIGIRMAMSFLVVSVAGLTGTPIAGALISRQNGSYVGAANCAGGMVILGTAFVIATRWMVVRRKGTVSYAPLHPQAHTCTMTTSVKLNSGHTIPTIGFGTWQSAPHEVENAVEAAIKAGYRHLDLAKVYENQEEVQKGMMAAGVDRSSLFITSKLWNNCHQPDLVEAALDDTLKELGLSYLDLYLIHWPVAFAPVGDLTSNLFPKAPEKNGVPQVEIDTKTTLVDTWRAMIKLLDTNKVRSIGVSNFPTHAIDELIKATGVTPAVHQIERHPLLIQPELVKHHAQKGIHITAYSPLGNNNVGLKKLFEYPEVIAIAKKIGATPAQVLIAWGAVGGHSVIPKSVTPERIASNFKQIKLSDEDVAEVSKLGEKPHRFNIPLDYRPQWDINVFNESDKIATHKLNIV